jgi:hypothetical protein
MTYIKFVAKGLHASVVPLCVRVCMRASAIPITAHQVCDSGEHCAEAKMVSGLF